MWKQNLEQRLQNLWKGRILKYQLVVKEDKIRENQPKVIRKQTLVYPVNIQQRPPDDDYP